MILFFNCGKPFDNLLFVSVAPSFLDEMFLLLIKYLLVQFEYPKGNCGISNHNVKVISEGIQKK